MYAPPQQRIHVPLRHPPNWKTLFYSNGRPGVIFIPPRFIGDVPKTVSYSYNWDVCSTNRFIGCTSNTREIDGDRAFAAQLERTATE